MSYSMDSFTTTDSKYKKSFNLRNAGYKQYMERYQSAVLYSAARLSKQEEGITISISDSNTYGLTENGDEIDDLTANSHGIFDNEKCNLGNLYCVGLFCLFLSLVMFVSVSTQIGPFKNRHDSNKHVSAEMHHRTSSAFPSISLSSSPTIEDLSTPTASPTHTASLNTSWCGITRDDAENKCGRPCPSGEDSECIEKHSKHKVLCFNDISTCAEAKSDKIEHRWCGHSKHDVNSKCRHACATGLDSQCPKYMKCHRNVEKCSRDLVFTKKLS